MKLAVEFTKNNLDNFLMLYYSNDYNRTKLFKVLKDPSIFETIKQYLNVDFRGISEFYWVFDCILYDAPDNFYMDYLNEYPNIILNFRNYNLASLKVSSDEYPRIYNLLKRLLFEYFWSQVDQNDERNIEIHNEKNLLFDILFGPQDIEIDINLISSDIAYYFVKIALIANKQAI